MSNGAPAVHSVHIYGDDRALIARLCGVVSSGLQGGDAVLIIATAAHRVALANELEKAGVDVRAIAKRGRFRTIDASSALASFMRYGRPDRGLFMTSMNRLLQQSAKNAMTRGSGLTVFGEMVTVLWEEGKKEAALQLEALWNEVLNDRAFHLHCAYPRTCFTGEGDGTGLASVCASHTHVVRDAVAYPTINAA